MLQILALVLLASLAFFEQFAIFGVYIKSNVLTAGVSEDIGCFCLQCVGIFFRPQPILKIPTHYKPFTFIKTHVIMKQTLFYAVFALLLLGFQANAQVSFKAGVNIASLSNNAEFADVDEVENTSVVGGQAGFAFDLGLSDLFTIQPELLWIQKGGKTGYTINEDIKYSSRTYYNYVEVPVLAKLKFFTESGSGVYLVAGPYAGLAFSGKNKTTLTLLGNTTTTTRDIEFDNKDADERNRRLDWGISFGGGLKFGHVYLDARYNLGINNLLDSDTNNSNDDKPYLRNRGLGLVLGYEF